MAQPRPPSSGSISGITFPQDLSNVGFYMSFIFSQYQRSTAFSAPMPSISGGAVALPMPDSINDNPTVVWNDDSLTRRFGSAAEAVANPILSKIEGAQTLKSVLSNVSGLALDLYALRSGQMINPFLVMLFKQPEFKTFKFSWTLTPRTQSESESLNKIIKNFRKYMQPDVANGGLGNAVMEYPYIVKPQFHPSDYMFDFKYCAIKSINVDYTGAGMPAFFTTNAPVAVRLDIHLTEIDLWMRSDLM